MWHSTHSHSNFDRDYDRWDSNHEHHGHHDRDRYDDYNHHHSHHYEDRRCDDDWRGNDCHDGGHHGWGHDGHDQIIIIH